MTGNRRRRERLDLTWDAIAAGTPALETSDLASEQGQTLRWFQAMADLPVPASARERGRGAMRRAVERERTRQYAVHGIGRLGTAAVPWKEIGQNGARPPATARPPASRGIGRKLAAGGTTAILLVVVALLVVLYVRSASNTADQPDHESATPAVTTPPGTWPMFGANAARTGATADRGPVGPLTTRWTFQAPFALDGPVVAAGSIYVVSPAGVVYAVDAENGQQRWTFNLGTVATGIYPYPAIAGNTLYVASAAHGVVSALDTGDGSVRWTYETGSAVSASPLVVDGMVFVAAGDGAVYALDAETGARRWSLAAGTIPNPSSPVHAAGRIYVGDGAGTLVALDAASGATIWTQPLGQTVRNAAVVGGAVFVTGPDLGARAVDAETGAVRWSYRPADGSLVFGLAIADGKAVVNAGGSATVALDVGTGATIWSASHPATNRTVAIAAGVAYVAEMGNAVVGYDLETGGEVSRGTVSGTLSTPPAIAENVLYAADNSGTLTALMASNGIPAPNDIVSGATPTAGAGRPSAVEATFLWSADAGGSPLIAFAPDSTVWAQDIGTGLISILDRDGALIDTWGTHGNQPGQFDFQIPGEDGWWGDITFGPDGSLYVAECGNHRVEQFDAERHLVQSWGGTMSLAPGQFHCPSGIVVLPDGDILVADINRGDVQRFNADGTFDRSLGSFATPSGINFDADGNLVIVDSKVARVNVVTPDGVVRLSFGTQGSAPGQLWQPDDAVRDEAGNFYVTDENASRVSVFDRTGAFIGSFGEAGTGDGQFDGGTCTIGYGGHGSVYVGACEGRVQKFKVVLTVAAPDATPPP
jgi:outer membrane protein assembly factor BamB